MKTFWCRPTPPRRLWCMRELRLWKYLALRLPTHCLFLYTWTTLSALLHARSMYAIRVLQSHGMSVSALQQVFHAVVISKLTYASPGWWCFTTYRPTRINPDSGHRLCHLTFLLLRICAQQLTTNILVKLLGYILEPHITCISPTTTIHRFTMIRPRDGTDIVGVTILLSTAILAITCKVMCATLFFFMKLHVICKVSDFSSDCMMLMD